MKARLISVTRVINNRRVKTRCVGRGQIDLTFIEIIDTFTFYGIDVILLAAATALITQLMKKTLFARAQKKIVTFLPFLTGIFLYAVYAGVRNMSVAYLFEEYTSIIEHGISVGTAATLYYVLYEQFVRKPNGLSETEKVVAALIEGYVPSDSIEAAAKAVAEAIGRDVTGNGAARAQEIIAGYADGEINEKDVVLLSKLIIETLAHMSTR